MNQKGWPFSNPYDSKSTHEKLKQGEGVFNYSEKDRNAFSMIIYEPMFQIIHVILLN